MPIINIESRSYSGVFNPKNGAEPTPAIILDTDMGNDIDDALALVMLHNLEDAKECRLLGVTISKDNPWAVTFTRLLNARCRRPDLPIGRVYNGATPDEGNFIRQASQSAGCRSASDKVENAITLLRRLLAQEKDHSVTLLTIGFFTNVSRLLDSPPDEITPLSGRDLFARKVRQVVSMAAGFCRSTCQPNGHDPANPEFNVRMDIPAAQNFITNCPRPITFSGWEIGMRILFPGAAMEELLKESPQDILGLGYMHFFPMPYDRPSWDMTAVLQAVRPGVRYFELSAPGRVRVDAKGKTVFTECVSGLHRFLLLPEDREDRVKKDIVDLCIRPIDKNYPSPHVSLESSPPKNIHPL